MKDRLVVAFAEPVSKMPGITLGFAIVAPVGAWLAFQSNVEAVRAIGVLVVPFALFCWIFTTIRAIHQRLISFWFTPSTYVSLVGTLTAVICLFIGLLFLPDPGSHVGGFESYNTKIVRRAPTPNHIMMYAAALIQVGTTMWCLLYNWKKTETLVLAISLTALQTLLSSMLVALLRFRVGNSGGREQIERKRVK